MPEADAAGVGGLEEILARLESSLGPLAGVPAALSGGITNDNFRVTLGGDEYVIRLHGRNTGLLGIDREAERLASDAAAGLGIAPAVSAAYEDCLVTRFIACDPLSPREIGERAGEIALALRRFHDSSTVLARRFWVPELLEHYARVARERGGALPDAYADALAVAARIAAALAPWQPRPCHNDLLAGNIISTRGDGRLLILDWEYAGMGHPSFDLGNLSVNNDFDERDDERLLSAYYGEPPSDARRGTLKLMRILSDAREGAWGVLQSQISALDFDFDGYARTHFERLRANVEQPQLREWLAAASTDEERDGQAA
jgi:thiamine kinase-like enzyme